MNFRSISNTALQVSPLCLGTMTFGTPVGEADAIRLVHWALDHGINFIDTANIYEGYKRVLGSAGGIAEIILGKALQSRRAQCVLATKAGNPNGPGKFDKGLSRAHLLREIDKSLQRLQTDLVDLFYLHRPDPETPLEESVGACAEMIRAGKIRHWGFSNFDADQLQQILSICDSQGLPRPVASQPPLSLLKQDVCKELLPLCAKEGIATMPYQVLQSGLLSGKYSGRKIPPGSRAAEKSDWLKVTDETFATLDLFEAEARRRGLPLMQFALRWALKQPSVVSLVIGVKNVTQAEALLQALEGS